VVCAVVKLLYSSSTWWAIVAQYKDFKTIVNNSTADRQPHFLTETQSLERPSLYI